MKIAFLRLACLLLPFGFVLVATTPSRAEIDYPFCKTGGGDVGIGSGSCKFTSLEQCRESSAGFGMCYANTAYAPSPTPPVQRRGKRG